MNKNHAWRLSLSLSLSISVTPLLSACAPPSTDALGRASEPIINGVVSGPKDDSAVLVAILDSSHQMVAACTGTLLAANVVLTARHCVSETDETGIACDVDGTPLAGGEVYNDFPPDQLGVLVGTTEKRKLDAHAVKIFHTPATNLCNSDIALLLLDKPVDAPISQIRLDAGPRAGEMIAAVGWGVSNDSDGFERRRRDDVPVEAVGPTETDVGGAVGSHEFQVGEAICQGDSGGPAFAKSGAVLGVVSRGGNGRNVDPRQDPDYAGCIDQGPYVASNLYTRVDTFADLITSALGEAGTEPWRENSYDPRKSKFGESCNDASQCRSNICTGSDMARFCSQACDPAVADACPTGFKCANSADGVICLPPHGCSVAGPGAPAPAPSGLLVLLLGMAGLAVVRLRRRAAR